jgi:hypothetical protein
MSSFLGAHRARWLSSWALIMLIALTSLAAAPSANAASSKGCEGGGFRILGLSGEQDTTVPASALGTRFLVQGKYVEFTVVAASFGLENYTMTGAPNPLDITGGARTVVFASKTPDHRGLALTSGVQVELEDEDLVIERSSPSLTMKIQAKDCANGGIFQMEVERDDNTATRFVHTLADGVFFFDNPRFRAREGDVVPYKDITATVTNRINFANNSAPKFVGRDSPQVATRVDEPGCTNVFPNRPEIGGTDTVQHCGGRSIWDVASGGRMGQVMGEDATEVAPPATNCTQNCQAQNRVRGRSVVLGFPFPVPAASRLTPRLP